MRMMALVSVLLVCGVSATFAEQKGVPDPAPSAVTPRVVPPRLDPGPPTPVPPAGAQTVPTQPDGAGRVQREQQDRGFDREGDGRGRYHDQDRDTERRDIERRDFDRRDSDRRDFDRRDSGGRDFDRRERFRDRDYDRPRRRVCIEDEDGDVHCRYR